MVTQKKNEPMIEFEQIDEEEEEEEIFDHLIEQQNKTFNKIQEDCLEITRLKSELESNQKLLAEQVLQNGNLSKSNKELSDELEKILLTEEKRENEFLKKKNESEMKNQSNEEFTKTMIYKYSLIENELSNKSELLKKLELDLQVKENACLKLENELKEYELKSNQQLEETQIKNQNLRRY